VVSPRKDEPPGPGLLATGEVMARSGLSRQVLYQYTAMGLIQEAETTAAGHRLYPERVLEDLRLIRLLNETGYALRDIKEIFFRRRRG
jgi:DNA-binding transcriptional MerR regulator